MARFGKGKPMGQQADAFLKQHRSLSSRHAEKARQGVKGSRTTGKIHSVRTFDNYVRSLKLAGLWAQQEAGIRHLTEITPALAQQYLEQRQAEGIGQKQLDADRNALQFVTGKDTLERIHSTQTASKTTRSYTDTQVQRIANAQTERNRLSTELAFAAGLRAHELFTLQRLSEAAASTHRRWHVERFDGRDGERYIVTGKGGLSREVLIPTPLAARLEATRLPTPKAITDRGVNYTTRYDIAGGNAWSRSFGAASMRVLKWSNGAHGVRHSYAQARLAELQNKGYRYVLAREVVSQELGHFRGDIVETYLR